MLCSPQSHPSSNTNTAVPKVLLSEDLQGVGIGAVSCMWLTAPQQLQHHEFPGIFPIQGQVGILLFIGLAIGEQFFTSEIVVVFFFS